MRRTAHSFFFHVVPRGACHKFPRSREDPTSHHVSPSHDRRRHHADRGARSRLDAARSDLRGRSRDLSCPFASFLFARWGFFSVEADRVSTTVGRRPSRAPSIASSPPASPPTPSSRRIPRAWSGRDSSSSRPRGPSRSPSSCSPRPSRCVRRLRSPDPPSPPSPERPPRPAARARSRVHPDDASIARRSRPRATDATSATRPASSARTIARVARATLETSSVRIDSWPRASYFCCRAVAQAHPVHPLSQPTRSNTSTPTSGPTSKLLRRRPSSSVPRLSSSTSSLRRSSTSSR